MISDEPHKIVWYFAPIILLLSCIAPQQTLDFQYHDTYFVVSALTFGQFFAIFSLFCGAIYWVFRNYKLYKWITVFHIISIIIIPLSLLLIISSMHSVLTKSDSHSVKLAMSASKNLILIFLLSQILFVVNTLFAIFRKTFKI